MATRRKPVEALLDSDGEVVAPPVIDDIVEGEESQEVALISVLEQLGPDSQGAKVMVYRITDDRRKPDAFLRRFTPEEFASDGLETLLRMYGGGMYKISVYGPNGRLIRNPTISIEAPAGYKPEGDKSANQPQQSGGAEIAVQLIGAMQQGFERMGQMIASIATPSVNQHSSRADMLREMVVMKDLFSSPSNSGPIVEPGATMEMFLKGIEFGKSLLPKDSASENDVLMGMLESFGKPIVEAALKAPQPLTHQNSVERQQIAKANVTQANPQQQQNQQQNGEDEMSRMLKQALGFLVSQAERGNDPLTYANMVLDHVDESVITEMMNTPDWLDRLSVYDERVKKHVHWFADLRVEIQTILTMGDDSGDDSGNSAGTESGPDAIERGKTANVDDDSFRETGNH